MSTTAGLYAPKFNLKRVNRPIFFLPISHCCLSVLLVQNPKNPANEVYVYYSQKIRELNYKLSFYLCANLEYLPMDILNTAEKQNVVYL